MREECPNGDGISGGHSAGWDGQRGRQRLNNNLSGLPRHVRHQDI